jgi:hypothetical protein
MKFLKMSTITDIPDLVLSLSPEFEPPEVVEGNDSSVPNVASLIPAQRSVYDEGVAYVQGTRDYNGLLVEGYAGTGKTYTIVQLIKQIIMLQHKEIAITAPTNKAVKVLRKTASYKHNLLIFKTIHSLLGLKEDVDENGKQTFKKDYDPDNPSKIAEITVLIIDETSMLQDELYELIKQETKHQELFIIYMGDPAQIPPVGRIDCIPFRESKREIEKIHRVVLSEIVRQKGGNPILELATCVREHLKEEVIPYNYRTQLVEHDGVQSGIVMISAEDKESIFKVCEHYFTNPRFTHDPDFMKVISWTNKVADWMNDRIRRFIYKEELDIIFRDAQLERPDKVKTSLDVNLPKVLVGEKMIADKPIFAPEPDPITGRPKILFSTNDEFVIEEFTTGELNVFGNFHVKVYHVTAAGETEAGKITYKKFDIVHEDGEAVLTEVLRILKQRAIDENRGGDKYEAKKKWRYFYSVENQFAAVKYNYAITAHKSQGSTYDNCIVIDTDIDKNGAVNSKYPQSYQRRLPKIIERNRIKYVAYTRARNLLFIVK